MKIHFYNIISLLGVLFWVLIGSLTIISYNINQTNSLFINSIMSVIFIAIGYFLYVKSRNAVKILTINSDLKIENQYVFKIFSKFLQIEIIFMVINFLISILLLSGTLSRVLFEKVSVFG